MKTDFANFRPAMSCWDIRKMNSGGGRIADRNIALDGSGNPVIPDPLDEYEIGRWHMREGSRPSGELEILRDSEGRGLANPDVGPALPSTIFAGDFKCLVTNKALRFIGKDGTIPGISGLYGDTVLAFTLPYNFITEVIPGKSSAVYVSSPLIIHCGQWQATVCLIHATRANAKFGSSIMALNHLQAFGEQVVAAHTAARATPEANPRTSWSPGSDRHAPQLSTTAQSYTAQSFAKSAAPKQPDITDTRIPNTSETLPPANAFSLANEMMQGAAKFVQYEGEKGAYWQISVARPDDPTCEPEVSREILNSQTGRALIQHRAASGFQGLLGFSCLEISMPRLYVEVFDTRPGFIQRRSIALAGGLKRTFLGKYRTDGGLMEILGHPSLQ